MCKGGSNGNLLDLNNRGADTLLAPHYVFEVGHLDDILCFMDGKKALRRLAKMRLAVDMELYP